MMVPYFTALLVAAGVALLALGGLLADRSGRERAWRRIAEERRWNIEFRAGDRPESPQRP